MTDRHAGYVVVLEDDMREDDARDTIIALLQIKGVISVQPIILNGALQIAVARAKQGLLTRLIEIAETWKA